jgi:hypothetical protein
MHNITKAIKKAVCSIKKFTRKISGNVLKGGYISSSASATRRRKGRKTRTWRVAKKPRKTRNIKSKRRSRRKIVRKKKRKGKK